MKEIFSNNPEISNKGKIVLQKETIKKESEKISIPFSAVTDTDFYLAFEQNNIYNTLFLYYKKTAKNNFERDKNSILSANDILSEKLFAGKTITDAILEELEKELAGKNLELKDIKEVGINEGILVFRLKSGEEINFDLSARDLTHLLVKQELQNAKEEVESHIASYVIGGTILAVSFFPAVDGGYKIMRNISWKVRGKTFSVKLDEKIKGDFNEKVLLKILEKKGVEYDPKTDIIKYKNPIDEIKAGSMQYSLEKMSYSKWKKQLEKAGIKDIPNEKEFEKMKSEGKDFINKVYEKFQASETKGSFGKFFEKEFFSSFKQVAKIAGEKSVHYALLPIFLQEIHQNMGSTQSYMEAGAETIGFMGGAAFVGRLLSIGGPKNPLIMFAGSLIGGIGGTMVSKGILEHYDKKLLSVMPNKDIEDGKKSVDMHILNLGTVYDFLDTIDYDFIESPIDMTNNINASTAPEFYLAKRFSGIKHWNKELEQYKQKVSKKIDEFLYKDYKYYDILKNKDDLLKSLKKFILGKKYEKQAEEQSKKITDFIEKNLPVNLYCGDSEGYKKFEEKFGEFLKSFIKDEEQVNMILINFKKESEKKFLENIENITGVNRDILQRNIGNSGKEGEFMNGIQKEALKKLSDHLYYNYARYKKDGTVDYKENERSYKVSLKTDKLAEQKANFIKNYSLQIIDRNKIDENYIKEYKKNIENKKGLLELAFEGKLTTTGEEGKYFVVTDGVKSMLPTKNKNGEVEDLVLNENIDDILYINSLSKDDREFIKNKIFNKILEGKPIFNENLIRKINSKQKFLDNDSTIEINNIVEREKYFKEYEILNRFQILIQNPKFYSFYKRMLILAKQNNFIRNIENFGTAVEWHEENSYIYHPINNFKKLINKILDNQ